MSGLSLACLGAMYISDFTHKSFTGLIWSLAIFIGGMVFGKFGLE